MSINSELCEQLKGESANKYHKRVEEGLRRGYCTSNECIAVRAGVTNALLLELLDRNKK